MRPYREFGIMTAVAAKQPAVESSFSPLNLIGLALGVLMLIAYFVLPWVNQPGTGASTVAQFTATRSSNELDITTEGLATIPMAALTAVLVGAWALIYPKQARTAAVVTAVAGVVPLVYYILFFQEAGQNENDLMAAMGAGFWVVLAAAVGMIAQYALPREHFPGYELNKALGNQETVLALSMVVLIFSIGIANPRFLAERNLSDVLQGHAYVAVAAIGMSMVIISGNIDISIGSLIGVLAVISGNLAVNGVPIWLSWVIPVFIGAFFGGVIGFFVAYLRIPAIIVTLGFFSILRGGLVIVTNGAWIDGLPEGYALAQMRPLGIPMPIYFMIGLTILAALWMRYSMTGRAIYAVGSNREAARLSGISERAITMRVFILNGFFAGIAAILYATQLTVIQSTTPPGLELLIITSSVVGGVSILGGTGTVIGATLAAILLNMIRSAMVFINVSPFWLQAVQGVLILATVLVDLLRRRRQRT